MKKNIISVAVADAIAERFGLASANVTYNAAMSDGDSGVAFMISQLAFIEPKLYETPYADIFFENLVPIDTSIPEWTETVNYRSYDGVTMGKFIGASADDLPSVAMSAEIHTVQLGYAGMSVQYSLDELRKSTAMNMPIDQTQMRFAYRGAKEHQQKIVFFGDAKRKMYGLFNHPNVTKTNSRVDWNTASAQEILDDINKFLGDIWEGTNQRFMPNTLLLDTKRYRLIANKPYGVSTNGTQVGFTTVLDFLKQKNIATIERGIQLDIRPIPFLLAAQLTANGVTGNKDRMVAYEKSPDNLVAYMPIAPRFIAPQYHNLMVKVPMEYKISGTEFRYPQCAAYCEFDTAIS